MKTATAIIGMLPCAFIKVHVELDNKHYGSDDHEKVGERIAEAFGGYFSHFEYVEEGGEL